MGNTKAWAASSLALLLVALLGWGMARLWNRPPVATPLGGRPMGERRLVVGGADVLVIEDKRAFRVDAALHVKQLAFPELKIDAVESAALRDGKLALTAKAHDHDPDTTFPVVLLVDDEKVARIYKPGSDVKRAHVSNVLVAEPEEGEPKETRFAVYLQEDNGVWRLPLFAAGRDADEDRHAVQAWLRAHTVEKIVWRAGEGPLFLCATERRHLDEKQAPVMPTVAIDVFGHDHETPETKPLPLVLLGDQPAPPPPKVDLAALASRAPADTFVAAPLGKNWLWLGDAQALLVDPSGARLDVVSRRASFHALTDEAGPLWHVLALALLLGALALPLLIVRALRAATVANARALFGTLRIPGGGALDTDKRGHVNVSAGSSVRVEGHDVELGAGLRRADARLEVPLIDGDAVFILGRVQGDEAGPWRSSGHKRLVADGGHYAIGRGGPNDFAEQVTARAHALVLKVALGVAALAVVLLLRFGSAAFG